MRLVTHSDARLRLALFALLILHPEWGPYVDSQVRELAEPTRTDLQGLYAAAVYLQRLWQTRLGFYLGRFGVLPDLYSSQLVRATGGRGKAWENRSACPFYLANPSISLPF